MKIKIKDLIDTLKILPFDVQILVQGYEDGFDDIKNIRKIAAAKKTDAHDWEGEYEEIEKDPKDSVPAIVIMGNRR